jgi:hypothetical protein
MPKKPDDVAEDLIPPANEIISPVEAAPEAEPEPKPEPVPFVHVHKPNPSPTQAQHSWMSAHPTYRRTSHSPLGRFTFRGTLTADGDFIPENKMPVMDGAGSFGVGIPI